MRMTAQLLSAALLVLACRSAQNPDCPPCYTLVQEAVDAHRAKLEQLSALIRNVTDSPSLPDDRQFEERLQEVVLATRQLLESAQTATSGERSPLQLLGDLQRLRQLLTTYGLTISNNRHPTYRPAGSLLDIVAVSRPDYLLRAGVTRCHYGTPHDYTRAVLQCTGRTRVAGPVTQRRRLGRIDADSFNRQLNNIDWSPVFRTQLTASKWESFCDIFLGQLDTVAPVTRVQQRPPGSLLVSAPTRDLMARRRQALRPGGDRENYKELNRLCRAAVRKDQQAHINRELAKAGPSKVWRVLRPIIGSKKEAAVPSATPDALNDYYVSIGPITAASVPPPTVPVPVRLPRVTTSRFRPQPIDMDTLGLLLLHMKPSTSTGNDGISVSMFRTFFWGMGHVLLDIVNSSLTTSNVPGPWKHAMVTPIPKGQGPSEPANTRPISILPAIMKVVERVVQRQLVQYLEANQLLSTTQHGYRSGRSTETALSVITDRALEAMDAGEVSILVLLDLSKCFDVVPHGRLLDKLALYGVRLDEVRELAGQIVTHTEQARLVAGQGERNVSDVEQLLDRLDKTVKETLEFLERDGADALSRAVEQSKQFGIQSGRMSEIAREARRLADQHEAQAANVSATAVSAVNNATDAYELARQAVGQQRNFSNEMQLLETSLGSLEQLVTLTRQQAAEARRDAGDAADSAISVYTEAKAAVPDVDVDGLKRRADELRAQTQRLSADLEALTAEHGPLLGQLEADVSSVSELLARGLVQQQQADELMAAVDAARDKAVKAVTAGEQTLEDARGTLETLQGFDRSVQESRQLAAAALQQVADIADQIGQAERQTADARAALQGAETNADDARDIAAAAETMAEQAQSEATAIQAESAATKGRAAALRQEAADQAVRLDDTAADVELYERQLEQDTREARDARQKANEASSAAQRASERVHKALEEVRLIEVALREAAGTSIAAADLDLLERRLEQAESAMAAEQLPSRIDALRTNRTEQQRMVDDYEQQLEELRAEVANIQDMADSLPTECYARVKLEP
ncbi:Laminin subunit gamma-1 [Amphibalanus amphitrite]|uniref:Laminin subunit gamma-1 n=1 Tax=Amphibalanus amphitrite TaxID=1232801 RepID=A0A6A4XD24_AMPAM|nr:Laminin subunit gamma-1 [Amphibalanus amphitrite]